MTFQYSRNFSVLLITFIFLSLTKLYSQTFKLNLAVKESYCPYDEVTAKIDTVGKFNKDNIFTVEIVEMYGTAEGPIQKLTVSNQADIKFIIPNISIKKGDYFLIKISSSSPKYSILSSKIKINYIPDFLYTPQKNVCEGSTSFLMSNNDSLTFNFQWFKDNVLISNANNRKLVIKESGVYFAKIKNNGCEIKSVEDTIKFGQLKTPSIWQTAPAYACKGYGVYLVKSYDENEILKKRWYKDHLLINDNNSNSITAKESGYYYFTVQQDNCVAKSDSVFVNIIENEKITDLKFRFMDGAMVIKNDTTILACRNAMVGLTAPFEDNSISTTWIINGFERKDLKATTLLAISEGKFQAKQQQGSCTFISKPQQIIYKDTVTIKINEVYVDGVRNLTDYGNFNRWYGNWTKSNEIWYRNSVPIALNSSYVAVQQSGLYTFTMDFNSCKINSDTVIVTKPNDFFSIMIENKLVNENDKVNLSNEKKEASATIKLVNTSQNKISTKHISVKITNDLLSEFVITNHNPAEVLPHDTIAYQIVFNPKSKGKKTAIVEFTSLQPNLKINNQKTAINMPFIINLEGNAKERQNILFEPFNQYTYGETTKIELNIKSNSGLAVEVMSTDTNIAKIQGNLIIIKAAGTTIIRASQKGNNDYLTAEDVSHILTIVPPILPLLPEPPTPPISIPLSTEEVNSFRIYPNPSKDKLIINGPLKIKKLTIYDMQGIIHQSYDTLSSNEISITTLSEGLYIIRLTDMTNKVYTSKILKYK